MLLSWQIIIRYSGDKREWEAKYTFFCKLVKNLNTKLLYLRTYNTHTICIIIFFPSLFYEWIKHRIVIYGECADWRGTTNGICSKIWTFKITVLKYNIKYKYIISTSHTADRVISFCSRLTLIGAVTFLT